MATTNPDFNPSEDGNIYEIKKAALKFEEVIRRCSPAGRRQSLALTNLETASMYAVKAAAVGDDE